MENSMSEKLSQNIGAGRASADGLAERQIVAA